MKAKFLVLALALLLAAILAGCATKGQLKARDAEIAELKQQLEEARNQCVILEDEKKAIEDRANTLQGELNDLSDKLQIEMEKSEKYTMLRVPERLLFNSSQSSLSSGGRNVLNDIAEILTRYTEYDVRVEGHADNRKIKPEFYDKFRSNWELSTARATEVVRYLINKKGLSPQRLIAVGYGENRPIASNDTAEGRQQNRRVEFYIAPQQIYKDLGDY
ncbi:MAG: flagellar motor protein MotB [Candidatus Zixiibacteriota bacterium]|nr:MAG: flagellar motor protein MotB [candidate division Zixibacteria bacterium]